MADKGRSKRRVTVVLLLCILAAPALLLGLWLGYAYIRAIDDEVTEGSAYGFEIGMDKDAALAAAKTTYRDTEVYVLYPLDHDVGPHVRLTDWSSEETGMFRDRDQWRFYFDEGFFDTLRLYFEGGRLVRIYRGRSVIEGP